MRSIRWEDGKTIHPKIDNFQSQTKFTKPLP